MNVTLNHQSAILTEKQKENKEYLVDCIDRAIAELVYDKDALRKAYNYYEGKRDKDQFRHLETNYGIGTPTSVEFIPLVKGHIDSLIGEHLQNKLKPKITCKDKKTITLIDKQRKEHIYAAELQRLQSQLQSNLAYMFQTPEERQAKQPPIDMATQREIEKLKMESERSFTSDFEIAAQNILTHLIQSREVDLYNKLKVLFLDLLVAGQCYYKVTLLHEGETPEIEVLSPFDVFFEKNQNTPYIKKSTRGLVRRWMNKQQIISKYGYAMSEDDIDCLDNEASYDQTSNVYYIRSSSGGLVSNVDVTIPHLGDYGQYWKDQNLYPVYEVEWLTNTKIDQKEGVKGEGYRVDPYEGVRIGSDIYVNMGKSENVIRTMERPNDASISLNGLCYGDRGTTSSLVLATANIQDKYDILHYYRDTLIANSGIKGDFLDVSQLPAFLGQTPAERLMKWLGYKKTAGIALIDTAQDGRSANHNTTFGGYDDTVPGDAIQAIELAIQRTEATCSTITGVFRERLGGIEQKDAVTNVEVGVRQSAIITKPYFNLMDTVTKEILVDSINYCKISYKKGFVGVIILGDKAHKTFTVDGKHISFTDHDVHIADSGDIIRDMQKIEQILMEMIKGGQTDIEVIFEAMTTESMTEMKESIQGAIRKQKEENNVVKQMQGQVDQLTQQLQQTQQEMQKAQQEAEALKNKNLELEQTRIQNEYALRKEANENTRTYNTGKLENDEKKLELEKLQLFDNNPYNNEVRTD